MPRSMLGLVGYAKGGPRTMATLQEVIGNRAMMDENLRERAGREYDAMSPEQQRAAYIHQARVIHEITYALQLAADGHSTLRSDLDLLQHITRLAWSTDGTPSPLEFRRDDTTPSA